MQLRFFNVNFGQETINDGYGNVERLREEAELAVDINDPFNKEAS